MHHEKNLTFPQNPDIKIIFSRPSGAPHKNTKPFSPAGATTKRTRGTAFLTPITQSVTAATRNPRPGTRYFEKAPVQIKAIAPVPQNTRFRRNPWNDMRVSFCPILGVFNWKSAIEN